jgi:hypothetical protein
LKLFKRPNFFFILFQAEWRGLGVQQSRGWVSYFSSLACLLYLPAKVLPSFILFPKSFSILRALSLQVHYAIHRPEPHILLYRRPKGYGQNPAPVAATLPQAAPVPMVQ